MAKKSKYSMSGIAAIAGGIALTIVEVVGAVSYLVAQAQPHYLVAGGAIITVIAAGLPLWAERAWKAKRRLQALMLWALLVPALATIFCAAVERTGGTRDEANRDRQAHAQRIELARSAVTDAKTVYEADEAKAAVECSKAVKGDPRGPLCKAAEKRADASRKELKAARDAQADVGVVSVDPQARRIAAILPMTEEQVSLFQPLVLPLSISIGGLLLIAYGAHKQAPLPVPAKKRRRRKAQRKPRSKPPAAQVPIETNVVPLRRPQRKRRA